MSSAILDSFKFGADGLVTAVAQDDATGEVLMVAHMNRDALARTLETKIAHYWSRSRGKLWRKGETSGHVQHVREVYVDCDRDCVLLRIEQVGGACHTGHRSCFYTRVADGGARLEETADRVFDPGKVY